MPHNKKHHYVPKFFLRNFSDDGKSIGIYNIRSRRAIPNGNLDNQCYRNYFYGKQPTIEPALGGIEGASAEVIKRSFLTNRTCPPRLSPDHMVMSHFIVLQAARTTYEADALNEATDKVFKTIYRDQYGDLSNYAIEYEDPVLQALGTSSQIVPIVYDLQFKLLSNETEVAFIASDNPVARHNQYYEQNTSFGQSGWGQAGLLVFVPLSPRLLLIAYDSKTYKVGDKERSLIMVSKVSDIKQLNALQWLNADQNIYFSRGQEDFVGAQAPSIISKRRTEKASVGEHNIQVKNGEAVPDSQRSLLHEFRPGLNIKLKASCISQRRHPQHPYRTNQAAPPRDAGYLQVVEDFQNGVNAKRLRTEQFFQFAAQHPLSPKHFRR